jgi:hypothetical protein
MEQLGWGEWYSCPRQQSPRGGKLNVLNYKKIVRDQHILNYWDKYKEIQ